MISHKQLSHISIGHNCVSTQSCSDSKTIFFPQDALHLQNRPFLHSTTVVFIVVPMLQVFLAHNIPYLQSLPYLFAVAVISHHLRDGHRRGLWFWPIGSTPAIPYRLYVVCIVALPYFVKELKGSVENISDFPVSNNLLFDVWGSFTVSWSKGSEFLDFVHQCTAYLIEGTNLFIWWSNVKELPLQKTIP